MDLQSVIALFQFRDCVLFSHGALRVSIVDLGKDYKREYHSAQYGVLREEYRDGAWHHVTIDDRLSTSHATLADAYVAYRAYVSNQPFGHYDTIAWRRG